MPNNLYPIFVKMESMNTLMVGGGNVALEKLHSILENAPNSTIYLVAPIIKEEIFELAKSYNNLILIKRNFIETDILQKDLIFLTTDNYMLHQEIKNIAKEKNILVNVADTPNLCDFYLGSIVKKGDLKIAISTNGKSPTLAKRLKEIFNEIIPLEINIVLDNMHQIRNKLNVNFAQKIQILNKITNIIKTKNVTNF